MIVRHVQHGIGDSSGHSRALVQFFGAHTLCGEAVMACMPCSSIKRSFTFTALVTPTHTTPLCVLNMSSNRIDPRLWLILNRTSNSDPGTYFYSFFSSQVDRMLVLGLLADVSARDRQS